MEKLENVYRELEDERGNLERARREAIARAEQERNSINQLRDELNRSKTKLDETKLRSDEERIKLELKIEDISNEKDAAQKESEELRVQLHVAEDRVDSLLHQLQETNRKLKDGKCIPTESSQSIERLFYFISTVIFSITYSRKHNGRAAKGTRRHSASIS